MNLFEKLNRLDDSLVESNRVVKKKKLTEGYRVEPKISKFNVGDRVAERYNDSEFNVGTIVEIKKDTEGTQYLVKWDYSDREDEAWLYGDVLSLWVEDETEDVYDDNIDEVLTEGISKGSLIRWLKDNADQDIPADDFNTLVNNLWSVIEKENEERKFYKKGYKSIEEVDVPQLIDSSDNPVHDIGYRLLGWSDYDDDIDEMLTESTEQYELSTLVKDSINHLVNDLGKDSMADDFGDDVCADLEDNYDIDVPQNPVKYADWCSAVMSEVSRQLNSKEELTEGNNVSSQLPSTIDSFLQDIAQMYGTITYKDIMEHEYTEEDLKKLKNYRRRFKAEIPYEGEEEADAILNDIAEKVAIVVKNSRLTEEQGDLVAGDGKMFVEEPLVEGASEIYYLELFSKDGRTFEQSFSTYQEAEEEGNFSLENNPMTKEYIIYDKKHKRVKHKH